MLTSLSLRCYLPSDLTKKHLFDFRYLLLRGRTFPLMNAAVPLRPERDDTYRASYPPYYFPDLANDVGVIWNTCLITSRTLGGSSGADRDNAACLYKTI